MRCSACGRPLRNPASINIGFGPVCARRFAEPQSFEADMTYNPRLGGSPMHGIVCRRLASGALATNFANRHVHHSPTGMEIGYGGSGPADFALNVMALLLPGHDVRLHDGSKVSREAWRLYQDFKRDFVADLPEQGGHIAVATIRDWIAQHPPTFTVHPSSVHPLPAIPLPKEQP